MSVYVNQKLRPANLAPAPYSMRLDGFASLHADYDGGENTKPLKFKVLT